MISIFSLASNSWIKMIPWKLICLILACSSGFMLYAPGNIAPGNIMEEQRWCICIVFVVFTTAIIIFAVSMIMRKMKQYCAMCQWRGKNAKNKIRALTDIAQMKVRENFEHGTPLRFDKEDSVYAELKNGNFIETLPYERKCCVDCKLEEWVLKCFKRYPDLVKELQEMDEAFREADRNFV